MIALLSKIEKTTLAIFFPKYGHFLNVPPMSVGAHFDSAIFEPVSPLKIFLALRKLKSLAFRGGFSKIVAYDIGSGTGFLIRILLLFRFERAVGIEYNRKLAERSQVNLKKFIDKGICTIHCDDATKFRIPDGDSIVFLFNPFGRNSIESFFRRNRDYFSSNRCYVVYINDLYVHEIPNNFLVLFQNSLLKFSILVNQNIDNYKKVLD